jgi:hypothetical protein
MTSLRAALRTSSIALSLTVAPGCEIDMSLGDLDDDTSSTGDDGPASSTTSGGAEGTGIDVAESTGTDSGAASDTDGTTSLDSGDTDDAVCGPPPERVSFDVDFDPEAFPDSGELAVDADCVIQGVADVRTYAIECNEGGMAVPHELTVRRTSGPLDLPLAVGASFHLQAYREYPIDGLIRRYVAVRDTAGELVLGWNNDGTPPANLGFDVDAWFAPLEYALAFGDCEPVPPEEPGTMFIIDPCPTPETRLAVDFQLGDDGIHLFEGISGQLGQLSLFVNEARHYDAGGDCPFPVDTLSFIAFREK